MIDYFLDKQNFISTQSGISKLPLQMPSVCIVRQFAMRNNTMNPISFQHVKISLFLKIIKYTKKYKP